MSHNNNINYTYNYQPYHQDISTNQPTTQYNNSTTAQSTNAQLNSIPQSTPPTLLPYHQYLALQKQGSISQQALNSGNNTNNNNVADPVINPQHQVYPSTYNSSYPVSYNSVTQKYPNNNNYCNSNNQTQHTKIAYNNKTYNNSNYNYSNNNHNNKYPSTYNINKQQQQIYPNYQNVNINRAYDNKNNYTLNYSANNGSNNKADSYSSYGGQYQKSQSNNLLNSRNSLQQPYTQQKQQSYTAFQQNSSHNNGKDNVQASLQSQKSFTSLTQQHNNEQKNFVQPKIDSPYTNAQKFYSYTNNSNKQQKSQNKQFNSPNKYNNNFTSKSHYSNNNKRQSSSQNFSNNFKQKQYEGWQQQKNHNHQQKQYNHDYDNYNNDWSQDQQQQQDEQLIYQRYQQSKRANNFSGNKKSKPIQKKKDSVLDSAEQIRKWVQARKRNYPGNRKRQMLEQKKLSEANGQSGVNNENNMMNIQQRNEMSILQSKIRKKILIINGDSRSMMKKIKNIQILKRIIQDPKVLTRERRSNYGRSSYNNNGSANNNNNRYNSNRQTDAGKNDKQQLRRVPSKVDIIQQQILDKQAGKQQLQGMKKVVEVQGIVSDNDHLNKDQAVDEQGQLNAQQQEEGEVQVQQIQSCCSSISQQSMQPQQLPANKLPRQLDQQNDANDQQAALLHQIEIKQKQMLISSKPLKKVQFFQFIDQKQQLGSEKHFKQQKSLISLNKSQGNIKESIKLAESSITSNHKPYHSSEHHSQQTNKPLDPQTIIAHLKQKQKQDKQSLNTLFDYKSNSYNYRYRIQTLQTNLKLDDIFAQTSYLLQAVRYIVKNGFFEEQEGNSK